MTPHQPTEREFGEVIGAVNSLKESVAEMKKSVADLQRTNSEEHAANAARMERLGAEMRAGLASKADAAVVERQGEKIDALESENDRRLGRGALVYGGIGTGITLLGMFIANHGSLHFG